VVYRTSSVKWHYETKHTNILLKSQEEKKHVSNHLTTNSLIKFTASYFNIVPARFKVSKSIAKHG
jgi:hypothetical protein